jgi:hypothetical protein
MIRRRAGGLVALAAHPATHVVLLVALALWKLRGLDAYLDLPNNDQLAYLDWAMRWRLDAKAPLYVGWLGTLRELWGASVTELFRVEKVATTALFVGALYLALRGVVGGLVAGIVAVHFLNLRYLVEETNGSHLFAMALCCLAMASLGLVGRRGVPSALTLLGLAALARTEVWLVALAATPLLLVWYVRGLDRGALGREALAWVPALAGGILGLVVFLHRAGGTITLAAAFRHSLVVSLVENLSGLLPGLAGYDAWVDARLLAPRLFRDDVTTWSIMRTYPTAVAMHVAANLVQVPRALGALVVKYGSTGHLLAVWALALGAMALAGRVDGAEASETASRPPRWPVVFLAGLTLLPLGFTLVFLKIAMRYLFVLLPLLALAVAGLTAAVASRLGRRKSAQATHGGALALVGLLLVYAALPLGPWAGLPAGRLPGRELVAWVAPRIPPGSALASDQAGFVCVFGARCRPLRLNHETLWDPASWTALGADWVFVSRRAVRRQADTPATPGCTVAAEGPPGILFRRSPS